MADGSIRGRRDGRSFIRWNAAMADTAARPDTPKGLIRTSSLELLGFIALVGPFYQMLRHPFRFSGYAKDGCVHFLIVATGLLGFIGPKLAEVACKKITCPAAATTLSYPYVTWINRQLTAILGIPIRFEAFDIVGPAYLFLCIALGLSIHIVWLFGRFLLPARLKQKMSRTSGPTYSAGTKVVFAINAFIMAIGLFATVMSLEVFFAISTISPIAKLVKYSTSPSVYSPAYGRGSRAGHIGFSITVPYHDWRHLVIVLPFWGLLGYTIFILFAATPTWIARIYGLRTSVLWLTLFAIVFARIVVAVKLW
jgi:hypothetical protein